MDNFYEFLIPARKNIGYSILNAFVYVFGVIALLTLFTGSWFFMFIAIFSAIIALISFFIKRKMYVEYEYQFTNGNVDIDVIYEKKRRKKAISFEMKEVELMAPIDSNYVKDFTNAPTTIKKCATGATNNTLYVVMITGGHDRMQLIIEPETELIDLCFRYNPRAVKKY